MISPDRLRSAHTTLQWLFVHARSMAYKREDQMDIGNFCDQAEHLASLLLTSEDATEQFDKKLEALSQEFRCPIVYQIWKKIS